MSKLSDAIRRTMRAEAAPMGFGAARPSPKATMLVGVLAQPGASAKSGAGDVLVVDGRKRLPSPADIEAIGKANAQTAAGLWAADADRKPLSELHKAGLDFLLFEPSTPASALLEDGLGFVLSLPDQPEESFLRSLEPLSLDAFYLDSLPSPLTVARQLELMRIGVFGRRPLMARVKPDIEAGDLECLRAGGVAVLLLEDASAVDALKERILALPPRRPRREERPAVTVPRAPVQAPEEEDDEDDE